MFSKPNLKLVILPLTLFVFSLSSFAGEPNTKNSGSKKMKSNTPMQVEVIDENGQVDLVDVTTIEDPNLNFDLKAMPLGNYSLLVTLGNEVINTVEINNLSADKNQMQMEVLNTKGEQVFTSKDMSENFNLTDFPKGRYTVNVYRGMQLINTTKMKN
jgi:hypothetical protein